MKSAKDNFSYFLKGSAHFHLDFGGPSSPTSWQALLRPGCRQSPLHADAISGSNKASIPGRTFFYFILVFIITISCSKSSTPEGILTQDEMVKAFTEFYLKEAKINALHLPKDSALMLFQNYKEEYAEGNHLPDSVLEQSYQYYIDRPLELSKIYDRIIDSLALKEQRPKRVRKELR